MSKQASEVERNLKLIFPDLESEKGLEKITKSMLHRGIRVDFYVPSCRLIIEVHGIQHFKPSGFGKNKVDTIMQYNRQQNRDDRLIRICKQFNINYEQVDYNEEVSYTTMFRKFEKYIDENRD